MFGLQTLELKSFTFAAKLESDGSVVGHYSYRDVEDGVPFDASGAITCLVVHGNHAWLGGVVEDSNDPSYVGQESWFQVLDNGEGANAPPGRDDAPRRQPGAGKRPELLRRGPEPAFPVARRRRQHPGTAELTSPTGLRS